MQTLWCAFGYCGVAGCASSGLSGRYLMSYLPFEELKHFGTLRLQLAEPRLMMFRSAVV